MALLSLQGVCLNLGGKPLLDNVDFSLEVGERVCLAGRNGAGKSTLLALMSGQIKPDSGTIVRSGAVFGQMPQDVPASWSGTVLNVVAQVLGAEGAALAQAHLESHPAAGASHAGGSGVGVSSDVWERYGEILGIINHLDLNPDENFARLSGGSKRRVALARALLCSEDLILDEPTNHLDISTITWLEDFLLRKVRTLVFVSHDRNFSSRLATRMLEVDRGKLYSYHCGFMSYAEQREIRLDTEEKHFALFDKKLAQEEAWIRQGVKARRTRNMGRVRALQEMRVERTKRRERQGNVSMFAQEAERSGRLVLEANELSYSYPDGRQIFSNFSTVIQRGDRVGVIGSNGAGKSTLLRVLLGELAPTSGTLRHGTRLEISYFDQLREALDPEASVMHAIADGNDVVTIGGNTRHVAGYLQDFLFTPDRLRLPVKALSGGERNRLLLARLFTHPSNLLVLDEPTNDLDMETLELLEELLSEYAGTVLLVSHDRSFLDNLVTSTLALEGDGLVHEYVGAYTDWLRQRDAGQGKAEKTQAELKTPSKLDAKKPTTDKARKRTFNEQREFEALTRELEELPARITALEDEQAQLEETLADPEFFTRDATAFTAASERLTALDDEQTELLARWEEVELRLDILSALS